MLIMQIEEEGEYLNLIFAVLHVIGLHLGDS
jgi:hypothetical protein